MWIKSEELAGRKDGAIKRTLPAKKKSLLWLIPVGAVVLIGLAALAIFVVAPALGFDFILVGKLGNL